MDTEAIVGRVQRFVETRELVRPGPLVVAVSGGQDSVCLLDVLRRLREGLRVDLHVAHLNHMFRGEQAESEAEYVRGLASQWGLPATVGAIDVPAYRARHRLAKQVAARYARYRFLAAVAGRVGASQVATGHTADDAVETLLINLLRGSGLAGLRGIAPSRQLVPGQLGPELEGDDWRTELLPLSEPLPVVVRPILELFRAETEGYCQARGLAFRRDPSNLDPAYRRSWVRQELLPSLERHGPGVRERLRGAADLLSDEYGVVARVVEDEWSRLAHVSAGRVEFGLDTWSRLEVAVQRQLLRRAMETLAGSLEGFGRTHVDASQLAIRRGAVGARLDLPRGIRLEKGYDSFWLTAERGMGDEAWTGQSVDMPEGMSMGPRGLGVGLLDEPLPLPVPGAVELPGGRIEARLEDVAEGEVAMERCRGDRWDACVDAGRVGDALLVRRRRPGDRFVPLGMDQPKKLHDFMVDEKIPRAERNRVPLVATSDQVVWVAGYRIDDRFKVTRETRRVVRLKFEP